MRKLFLALLGCLVMVGYSAIAQSLEVSGKVLDELGNPIVGATVQDRKSKRGTQTDEAGEFKISVERGSVLEVSYVGYNSSQYTVTRSGNVVINMTPTATRPLDEVVVTALGIKREKKALGYAVASVQSKDLELRPEGDVVRILNGKAPGVDIMNSSGISGSGTNIIIRGVSTITGSATPLFIVDGVPFDASTNAQSDFRFGNTTSSRFLDLDPNNIESIDVLKGLSATTLYGELGRNGVVLVTTKSGSGKRTNKKMEVSVTQSVFTNKVNNLPEYTQRYGGGFDQSLGLAFFSNWGAEFKDPPQQVPHPYDRAALHVAFPEFRGALYDYKFYNSVPRFFRTGIISTTSVGVQGGGQNTSFNVNYSYMDDKGFTPGNSLFKNNFSMGGSAKLANRMTVGGTFNYTITDFRSPPTSTSFGSNPTVSSVFGNLIYTPTAVDMIGLPYENPLDKSSVYYRSSNDIQHPIWTVKNGFTGQKVNRIFGNLNARYDILDNLNLTYRVGYDQYSDHNFLSQNRGGVAGGSQYQLGIHRTVDGYNTIWNHDLLLGYNTSLTNAWRLNVDAGFNSQDRIYEQTGMKSTQQLVYGLFNHNNFIVHEHLNEAGGVIDFKSRSQSVGVFAQAGLAYNEFLYLTVGGRNSWTSNLEKANRSIFYPSASVSFIPTSAFEGLRNSRVLNYLKLRAGYATSANFGRPYGTRPVLSINTNVFEDRVGTVLNSNTISNRLANPNLRPELLEEYEAGIEGKFFNNRVGIDLTFYQRTAKDQILDRDLDPSTGFTVTSINAGQVRNRGIEAAVTYTPVRTKDFRWEIQGNFTLYRSLVSKLPDEVKQIVVDGFSNEGLFAENGQPLGIIKATATARYDGPRGEAVGQRLVDGNGNYISSGEIQIVGNPIPNYKLTGINTLTWKGISFRMQWDYTDGGDILAYTPGTLIGRGITKDTDFDRQQSFILPGVNVQGEPNRIQTSASQAGFTNLSGFFGLADLITYDATNIRLREASLSYALPARWLARTPFGSLSLNFSGQNLWYFAPNFPKYTRFDPETSSLGVSNVRGLEYLSGPSGRRWGGSIRVTF